MKPFIITDQLGRNFNLSMGWEYYLRLETEDMYPTGEAPEGFNTSTLVVKLLTGALQLFPNQTLSGLINEVMPGLQVNLFEGFFVEASGKYWWDQEKTLRQTIQPVYKLVGGIEGSRYRKLLKMVPESSTWTMRQQAEEIQKREIQPDYMYVEGVPYTTIWETGKKLGVQFFPDAQRVMDMQEEALEGSLNQHQHQTFIEQNIRMPFQEMEKVRRKQEAALRKQKNQGSPIFLSKR